MLRMISVQTLNRGIEVEQQRALPVVTHHTLNPEKRRGARTTSYRRDMVKACGWIQNHMTRRKFYCVRAIRILDDQFPSVVLVWMREEQCSGKISSNPVSCSRNLPNGVVNVGSKRVPSPISIEQRWEYSFGQCRRNKQRVS